MKDDPILCWVSNGIAWIKPTGDAGETHALLVKEFARPTMHDGVHRFTVDLGECTGLDEHFTGTLAGLALRLRDLGRGEVRIVHCPPALGESLRGLGLERLFEM